MLALGFARGVSAAAAELSYLDLLKRLTDWEYLATLPGSGEKTAQWSSYNRRTRYDEATGKYVAWDANGDNAGIIRREGEQEVVGEMERPGCLWRIWSALPTEGHVRMRIHLDGASEPAVDLPFRAYFNGKNAPFTPPALVHIAVLGKNNYTPRQNNYTPIPYRKSCKMDADPGWEAYYHFDYTMFAKDTLVPTFKRESSSQESAAFDKANAVLNRCPKLLAKAGWKATVRALL